MWKIGELIILILLNNLLVSCYNSKQVKIICEKVEINFPPFSEVLTDDLPALTNVVSFILTIEKNNPEPFILYSASAFNYGRLKSKFILKGYDEIELRSNESSVIIKSERESYTFQVGLDLNNTFRNNNLKAYNDKKKEIIEFLKNAKLIYIPDLKDYVNIEGYNYFVDPVEIPLVTEK